MLWVLVAYKTFMNELSLQSLIELKALGFPQEPFRVENETIWGGSWYVLAIPGEEPRRIFIQDMQELKEALKKDGDTHLYKIPMLEEIIDDCDGQFRELSCRRIKGPWTAYGPYPVVGEPTDSRIAGHGANRSEAVKELWKVLQN